MIKSTILLLALSTSVFASSNGSLPIPLKSCKQIFDKTKQLEDLKAYYSYLGDKKKVNELTEKINELIEAMSSCKDDDLYKD